MLTDREKRVSNAVMRRLFTAVNYALGAVASVLLFPVY